MDIALTASAAVAVAVTVVSVVFLGLVGTTVGAEPQRDRSGTLIPTSGRRGFVRRDTVNNKFATGGIHAGLFALREGPKQTHNVRATQFPSHIRIGV